MKTIIFFLFGLAIALLFLIVKSSLSLFQIVPVTVAQSTPLQPAAAVELDAPAITGDGVATTSAPPPAALPTFDTLVTQQTFQSPQADPIAAAGPTTQALPPADDQVTLDQFIRAVSGDGTDAVTGVYISGRFSLPVLQQPAGDDNFVSRQDQTLTQFSTPNAYGTVGLLAHNNLSGKMFFDLQTGDDVVVVYGNGGQTRYRITQIERYQALSPTSRYSDFIDLSDPDQARLTSTQVFQRVYTAGNRVVFQTCIEANGDLSWGRLFVIAEKVSQ